MDYKDINDNELVSYVKESSEEANEILFEKYRPLIVKSARKLLKYCKYNGLELNDLIQEGMIGLSKAISTFNESKEASFFTYANKCIKRTQITLLIASQRHKHKFLNESMPFEVYDDKDDDMKYVEVFLADNSYNPENLLTDEENICEFKNKLNKILAPFEYDVFELKVAGFNYKEISEILEKDKKQVDNAIQRIKSKLKDELNNYK